MLKKYFTYEFKTTGHLLLPAFLTTLITTALLSVSFFVQLQTNQLYGKTVTNITTVMLSSLFLIIIGAAAGISFLLLFLRFYKTMTGREAYLTHTLPLSTHTILLAKTMSAFAWTLLIGLTTVVSFSIFAALTFSPFYSAKEFVPFFNSMRNALKEIPADACILIILLFLVRILFMIQHFFLATALGQLMSKYRALCTVAFYIGINCVLNLIKNIFSYVQLMSHPYKGNISLIVENATAPTSGANTGIFFFIYVLPYVILCAIFYALTHYIFHKKINLE